MIECPLKSSNNQIPLPSLSKERGLRSAEFREPLDNPYSIHGWHFTEVCLHISMAPARLLEKPVFAVTNFGTRIAVAVSLDSTVGDFKREFERAHLNCFPELGKIRVCSLKVRRKSCFYYLSELFPLKYAFRSAKGWFLHIAAHHSRDQLATKTNARRLKRKKRKMKKYPSFKAAFFVFPRAVYFLRMKKKKCHQIRRVRNSERLINGLDSRVLAFESGADGKWEKQGNLRIELECPNETSSETVSVSGIINRYFSSFDEVSSNSRLSFMDQMKSKEQMAAEIASDYQNIQFGILSPLVAKTPPKGRSLLHPEPRLTPLRDAPKTNVGIHLVEASKSLGLSTSTQSPALSLAKFIDGRSLVTESPNTHIRNLIFEIMDEDD